VIKKLQRQWGGGSKPPFNMPQTDCGVAFPELRANSNELEKINSEVKQ